MGGGNGELGRGGPDGLQRQQFVRRIGVGVQEADRQRLDPLVDQPARDPGDRLWVERRFDRAVIADAFGDAEPQAARDQQRAWLGDEAVERLPHVAADLEHILESGRGQHGALGQLAFQDGVRRDGRAVQQKADVAEREIEALRRLREACREAAGRVVRRRRSLVRRAFSASFVEDFDVGEGAADVDGDPNGFPRHRWNQTDLSPASRAERPTRPMA